MDRRKFVKTLAATASATALAGCTATPFVSRPKQTSKRLYIDGLSFIPDNHLDVKASEIDAYIADISAIESIKRADGSTNYKRTYDACMKSIKKHRKTMLSFPDAYRLANTAADIDLARQNNQCAVFFQIQGADCVEGGLHQVDEFYDLGLRVLQLTHHYNNDYAGGAISLGDKGLSDKGFALIDKLESKHMLIDLSHSSVKTAEQTLAHAKRPVVQSHGAARAIVNNARNSPDHVIKGIADSGGVFGVFMMSWWLTDSRVPLPEHYLNHLKHIRNIAGIEGVAIANDYPLKGHIKALEAGNNNEIAIDGYKQWWESLGKKGVLGFDKPAQHIVIPELNHIKRMRSIEYLLEKAGFKAREIDKVMGENWQRVLSDIIV